MKVILLGHTQLSREIVEKIIHSDNAELFFDGDVWKEETVDGQVIALAAIRQCYSHKTALEVLETESEKYFGDKGQEGKRLFNHIVKSGHTSTLEHINFTFTVEGVSRALLAQLTRHRQLSFSVQSQRYNKFSSDSRSGGFDYVIPEIVARNEVSKNAFVSMMNTLQSFYDDLIELNIPQEDARSVLPNAATCNLVTSGNLRAWLEFYKKRKKGEGAQAEIAEFAEHIKSAIVEVEAWTSEYFDLT
ncbi:FAD-dependent thymidylate synthase [Solibacillus isronensis]|uniref:FAD-dependent thymidylate synthase n=1 Tax=Solibacillus isronensis TaxID=412383 RepID=UPI0039A301BD